jgi:hypothetical protein
MPVLKITHGGCSAKMVNYLFSEKGQSDRLQAVGGNVVGRDPKTVEREFNETRVYCGDQPGRQYYHVAISFERSDLGDLKTPSGTPDYESIRDYGEEWAKEAGIADKHEYLVVVHGEKEHPHAHVVWSATGLDGRKYHDDKQNLGRLRDVNDRLARSHGIQRELDRVRDPHRPSDKFIRQAQRGGERYSWKLDLQDRIREAGRRAFSEEEFRARLKERGVELRIRGEKYSYSITDRGGKHRASREGRLGETYQRAHLVEKFGQQKEQLRIDPEGYRRRLKEEQEKPYSWQRDLRGRITEALKTAKDPHGFKESLSKLGVAARQDEQGRYHFSFKDNHGLNHDDVSADRLSRGGTERISARLQENALRGDIADRAASADLTRAIGGEARGLVTSLMHQVELATRETHHGHGGRDLPTREDLRAERSRHPQESGDGHERW